MNQPHAEDQGQQASGPGKPVTTDIFVTTKKFPGTGLPAAAPAPPLREKKKSSRIVIAVVLFILVIGGIAWVVQQLPNYRKPDQLPIPVTEIIRFREGMAVWDGADPSYMLEVENGSEGSYDYFFENVSDGPATVGVESVSCDCSQVMVTVLSPSLRSQWEGFDAQRRKIDHGAAFSSPELKWTLLDAKKPQGLAVPQGSAGLVRVGWKTRKTEGTRLRLTVRIWSEPEGKVLQRQWHALETGTVVTAPVMFVAHKVTVGTLASGAVANADVVGWSSTRKKLAIKTSAGDPLWQWELKELSEKSRSALEAKLRSDGINTRVQSAVKLLLTMYENKDGKQLEQGPFQRRPPLWLDDQALDNNLPWFVGRVKGEVEIGALEDQGKILLRTFKAQQGIRHRLPLRADAKLGLEVQSSIPSFLEVKLHENPKESTAGKRSWVLEVAVPPGSPPGTFTDESAILLRTKTTPPRVIRIPVLGTSVPG